MPDGYLCPATGQPHRFYGGPDEPDGCQDCDWGHHPGNVPDTADEPF